MQQIENQIRWKESEKQLHLYRRAFREIDEQTKAEINSIILLVKNVVDTFIQILRDVFHHRKHVSSIQRRNDDC